jgi:hypothetical protein
LSARPTLESCMAHISGFARDQLLLLPEAVDDCVDAENPVRFIDAVVDGLGLTAAGFARIKGKATGVGATRRAGVLLQRLRLTTGEL